ncbi:McrB family protein [Riemerella columbina]|uniref:McrB family protein n=1 Tax=Riemerella columbina TaxID=103810 RepID=UPI00266EF7A1|nr:AAA family ATPase [Riemerella columbina]WKS95886.1 AAA family ATPase [Riemerella columbina]
MQYKRLEIVNGEYVRDISISTEEWREILQDNSVARENYIDILLKFYKEPRHSSTCKYLGEKYGVHPQSINRTIINFSKAVQKRLNRFEIKNIDDTPAYWIITMDGKNLPNGLFQWTLKPELAKAIFEIFIFNNMNDNNVKFKKLLEYFVAYLEWMQTKDNKIRGYKKYIMKYEVDGQFIQTGTGDQQIQSQIKDWNMYDGYKINISINPALNGEYTSKRCYLQWEGTWYNIRAKWNEDKSRISELCLTQGEKNKIVLSKSLEELGIYDNKNPNDCLKEFFDRFYGFVKFHKEKEMIEEYIKLLEENKNLVLVGAPGTGKTFLAKTIAKQIIETEDIKVSEQLGFVQFHPSYDYTDFVEGLRPSFSSHNGPLGFALKDGVFKTFCKKALENRDKKYVFLIDEINRGDVSKIFGELFYSIDPNYRGEIGTVKTQYSNLISEGDVFKNGFFVPHNVYIIGTMNDIDRSVETFDFAMRRRFIWKEVTAEESAKNMKLPESIRVRMENLNNKISNIDELSSSFHIGAAYFLDTNGNPREDVDHIWNYKIESLLKEYLRGMPDMEQKIKELKEAYHQNENN